MSWYETEKEAQKACFEKEKEFPGHKFYVLKDSVQENCYWAQRKISPDIL